MFVITMTIERRWHSALKTSHILQVDPNVNYLQRSADAERENTDDKDGSRDI